MCTPQSSWLTSFTDCPSPTDPPQCATVDPIAASRDLTSSKRSAGPPAMISRSPRSARATPPLTGASSNRTPRPANRPSILRTASGPIVLMTTTTDSGDRVSAAPSSANIASSICFAFTTIRTSASAPSAASRGEPARLAPSSTSGSAFSGRTSKTERSKRAETILFAIGAPIAPSPMNPTPCIYPKDPSMIVAGCLRGDAPVLQGTFEYPAAVELIHGGAVDLLPGRLALGEVRDAFLSLAAFYLLVGDQHVTASGAQVDTDGIPRPQPGQAASRGALRRGVQDRRAVRGARLPAVAYGWQGVDPTLEERVWGLHVDDLGRARPPDGSGAPDHQNRALVDVEVRVVDTLVVIVRAVEDDRASLEYVFVGRISQVALAKLLRDHTGFDDSEVEEIAGEDPKTRLLLKRFVVGCDHLTVLALSPGYAFGQRPASDGPRPAVDLASLKKLAQHGRHAARAVEPLAQVLTRRLHVDEQGHIVAVLPIRGFDLDPRVARHGHDVRLGVGRAAYSRGRDDRVQKRRARQDLRRAQILVGHLSDPLPRVVGHLTALAVGRRDCCASRQRETEHLGQGIHCRGRTHSVAVACRRRGSQGRLEEPLFVDLASGQTAAALPDGRARTYQFALEVTVEHRTAGEHDGGDIHGRGGHNRRRRGLVAAGRKHHGVDKVTVEYLHEPKIRQVAVQRGGRPAAVLVDGVHGELHRDAPTVAYPIAHATGELQMMPVAGREVASALGDADYGPVGAQLVRCDPVVHKALYIQRALVPAMGIV